MIARGRSSAIVGGLDGCALVPWPGASAGGHSQPCWPSFGRKPLDLCGAGPAGVCRCCRVGVRVCCRAVCQWGGAVVYAGGHGAGRLWLAASSVPRAAAPVHELRAYCCTTALLDGKHSVVADHLSDPNCRCLPPATKIRRKTAKKAKKEQIKLAKAAEGII